VQHRLDFSRSVEKRSIGDHELRWQEAVASISNRRECPLYDGLVIKPQIGLVPVGRDPHSGLWEFAHLETGQIPERRGGNLVLTEETGLVFVLLPAGTFWMGARLEGPNADPRATEFERPEHEVSLEAFLLSKYEMTQGQWLLFTGNNPSFYKAEKTSRKTGYSMRHPVETISWSRANQVLERLGLVLPTEAQWEYAARAGTSTVWWTGNDRETLRGKINVADQAAALDGAQWPDISEWPDLNDGYVTHAPVGTFAANPFGLHEVHGNVREWCRDRYGSYRRPVDPVDGLRKPAKGVKYRIERGGAFIIAAWRAASARRSQAPMDYKVESLGVRPARVLAR
jgi:formylglycine-generating enzyme required for sulfatase activity